MELEIKELYKNYGDKLALNGVNLSLTPGIYALLGPNGAGKSTLISLITDSIRRTSGEILCDGVEVLKLGREFRRRFGYMPQQQKMYEDYRGIEFLSYMAVLKGLDRRKASEEIKELLHVVNLWEVRQKKIGTYSGGMKQRIMLAASLLGEPELLILDEPTAGLDPQERINIRNYIAEYAGRMIILFATHVVSDIECIAKDVILMKEGNIVRTGSPQELLRGVLGKVGTISCEYQEIKRVQERYCTGTISQTSDKLKIKVIGDDLPEECLVEISEINLEDVYCYYIRATN